MILDSVVTEGFEEHLKCVEVVVIRLVRAGLTVNRKKCEFFCYQVAYFGYLLDRDGLHPNPERVEPIVQYPVPRNVKTLRRFLGMVGWYARFIENESEVKIPLVRLLQKRLTWSWGEEQQQAFETLKWSLTRAPVLA